MAKSIPDPFPDPPSGADNLAHTSQVLEYRRSTQRKPLVSPEARRSIAAFLCIALCIALLAAAAWMRSVSTELRKVYAFAPVGLPDPQPIRVTDQLLKHTTPWPRERFEAVSRLLRGAGTTIFHGRDQTTPAVPDHIEVRAHYFDDYRSVHWLLLPRGWLEVAERRAEFWSECGEWSVQYSFHDHAELPYDERNPLWQQAEFHVSFYKLPPHFASARYASVGFGISIGTSRSPEAPHWQAPHWMHLAIWLVLLAGVGLCAACLRVLKAGDDLAWLPLVAAFWLCGMIAATALACWWIYPTHQFFVAPRPWRTDHFELQPALVIPAIAGALFTLALWLLPTTGPDATVAPKRG